MPDHLRKQIRNAVASAVTGLATTETRVHKARVLPLDSATALPALLVFAPENDVETVENLTLTAPRRQRRDFDLTVTGLAAAGAAIEDTLDAIAAEVEAVLGGSTLGGLATDLVLVDTQITLGDPAAAERFGAVELRWRASYECLETDPTNAV